MTSTSRVFLGLIAGLALGITLSALQHAALPAVVAAVEPIGTVWLNALRMTVVLLVVSLLVTGVAGASEAASSGRLALRALLLFVALLGAGAVFAAVVAPLGIRWVSTGLAPPAALLQGMAPADAATRTPSLAEWVLTLVPANPIAAAADNAMLPLVVFALFFGFAVTRIDPQPRAHLLASFQAVIDTMMVIVRWVLWAAPVGVFALVLPIAASAGTRVLGGLAVYLLLVCGVVALVTLALYPVATVFGRVSLRRFARAAAPAQAVAFSTQSSLAALPAMLEGVGRQLAVPPRVSALVLPLAVAMFRITGPVAYLGAAVFVAWLYGIAISPGQFAAGIAIGVVVGMGAVGLPGPVNFMATYVPVFQVMGLPLEPLALLLAVNAIPDIFMTVGNVTADMAVTRILAQRSPEAAAATDDAMQG